MGRAYNTDCSIMPPSFMEALASCIVQDDSGNTFLNVICYTGSCETFDTPAECAEMVDVDTYLVKNAFGLDICGNLALKLRVCDLADAQNGQGEVL